MAGEHAVRNLRRATVVLEGATLVENNLRADHMKINETYVARWIGRFQDSRYVRAFGIGMLAFGVLAQLYSSGVVMDMRIDDGFPQLMFRDDRRVDPILADGRFGWVVVGWFEYYVHRVSRIWFNICFFGCVFLFLVQALAAKLPKWSAAFKQGMEEGR